MQATKPKITGSQALMESLIHEGVKVIFGYPGGAIMPIYDALYDYEKSGKIHHVLTRHEQGAAHAAEGFGRATGNPGVCFATSGPGATNLVTGLADAMLDSTPMVAITGQVISSLIGTDAFQEADVIGITAPITKWNYQVSKASEIPFVIAKAFHIARTGRPGPVLVDITKDAQFAMTDYVPVKDVKLKSYNPTRTPHPKQIEIAAGILNAAKRPLLLVGHGVIISRAEADLIKMCEAGNYPAAATLHGLSSIPTGHKYMVGFLGMHGNYGPNVLTNEADVIVALGMRFDDRVTGRLSDYAKHAKVIHIDIDPAELNKNIKADVPIVADVGEAIRALIPHLKHVDRTEWFEKFATLMKQETDTVITNEVQPADGQITMAESIRALEEATNGEATVVADVGQHQMIAARYYRFKKPNSYISSGGMGTMGFSLPASIGVQFARPDKVVLSISGDGSFQMNLQELATIAQEKIPVKIIILNNHYLGMVRQWQQLFFDNRYSMVNISQPDFVKLAEAYSIPAGRVFKRENLKAEIKKMIDHKGPYLLDIDVKKEENVFPMVPTGASVSEIRLS